MEFPYRPKTSKEENIKNCLKMAIWYNYDMINGEWIKNCPKCGRLLHYHNKSNLTRSIKKQQVCNFCSSQTKAKDENYIHKISLSKMGDKNPSKRPDVQLKISMANRGKPKHTKQFREKISKLHTGKITSELTKQKMREAVLKKIQKYGVFARNFNPTACQFIDGLNQNLGWKLQHALNGGEQIVCGYSLDGYDSNKNIVLEYDENGSNHFDLDGNLKSKDIIRMGRIIKSLHCRFFRYNERTKEILEYDSNGSKSKTKW
jgi:hypothetical protein